MPMPGYLCCAHTLGSSETRIDQGETSGVHSEFTVAGRPNDKRLRGQALAAFIDRLDRLGEFLVVNRNGKQLASYALISGENRLPT
jgi:hypothetical protein